MNNTKLEQRNTTLDIIRITAAFSVISVHSLLNNGFYDQIVAGKSMYIACLIRVLFGHCVPLFIILSGYLVSHKTLSRKYYTGIRKTISIYVLASIACILYNMFYLNSKYTFKKALLEILGFQAAPYSWYVEMYIGLFLLIPFLNLIYNNLKNKKQKQILILTLFTITILPSVFNIYNFETLSWWSTPSSSDNFSRLIPAWWTSFYPVTYYFIGCYLREFKIKLKTKTILLLFVLCTIAFGTFNFYRSHGGQFKTGPYIYWNGFEPFILSTLLFIMLSRIKSDKIPRIGKYILWKISELTLCIYLVSYIFDNYAYTKLNAAIPDIGGRLPYFFIMVPFVFICSMLLSKILITIDKLLCIIFSKTRTLIHH